MSIGLCVLLVACGSKSLGDKKDHQLTHLDLTVTIPGETKLTPYDSTEYTKARCEYKIGGKRIEVKEIEMSAYPTDLAMVEAVVKEDKKFKAILDKKTLANGAFGVIYEGNGKTETFKDYLFYFKKGNRAYKITPVFNNDGDYFEENFESIGSLK
jgi:hypothetical protein